MPDRARARPSFIRVRTPALPTRKQNPKINPFLMQLRGVSLIPYHHGSPGGTYPPPDPYMKIRILPNRSRGGRCTEILSRTAAVGFL